MDVGKRLNDLLKKYLHTDFQAIMEGFNYDDVSKPADPTKTDEDAKKSPDQDKSGGKKKR